MNLVPFNFLVLISLNFVPKLKDTQIMSLLLFLVDLFQVVKYKERKIGIFVLLFLSQRIFVLLLGFLLFLYRHLIRGGCCQESILRRMWLVFFSCQEEFSTQNKKLVLNWN